MFWVFCLFFLKRGKQALVSFSFLSSPPPVSLAAGEFYCPVLILGLKAVPFLCRCPLLVNYHGLRPPSGAPGRRAGRGGPSLAPGPATGSGQEPEARGTPAPLAASSRTPLSSSSHRAGWGGTRGRQGPPVPVGTSSPPATRPGLSRTRGSPPRTASSRGG